MSKLYNKYLSLKQLDASKFYLFKSGIFYIFLDDDAKIVSEKLGLKLTYLNENINPLASYSAFTEGTAALSKLILKTTYHTNFYNTTVELSPNAPYELGSENTLIQEFTTNGEQVYAMALSNNGDINSDVSVIAEDNGLKVFVKETAPETLTTYLTHTESLVNYMPNSKFSIANYDKRSS